MEPDQTFVDHRGKEHPLLPPTDDMLYDGERIPLHRDLQQVLKDYTKAVMAERPTNVAEWSAEYFAVRARESARQGSPSAALLRSAPPQFRRLPVEVQDRVCDVFLAYDRDKSGFINKQEFWTMLKEVGAFFGVTPLEDEAADELKDIDTNSDMVLSWFEFATAQTRWLTAKGI